MGCSEGIAWPGGSTWGHCREHPRSSPERCPKLDFRNETTEEKGRNQGLNNLVDLWDYVIKRSENTGNYGTDKVYLKELAYRSLLFMFYCK